MSAPILPPHVCDGCHKPIGADEDFRLVFGERIYQDLPTYYHEPCWAEKS